VSNQVIGGVTRTDPGPKGIDRLSQKQKDRKPDKETTRRPFFEKISKKRSWENNQTSITHPEGKNIVEIFGRRTGRGNKGPKRPSNWGRSTELITGNFMMWKQTHTSCPAGITQHEKFLSRLTSKKSDFPQAKKKKMIMIRTASSCKKQQHPGEAKRLLIEKRL